LRIFTIGCTRTSAERFFTRLRASGASTLVDVRLSNASQLAGFAKRGDLAWFAHALAGLRYAHRPELAPTAPMLHAYRTASCDWPSYERRFLDLMALRRVEDLVPRELLDGACLLCSEATPERCHRRLVAEYLGARWGGVEIVHL
jgi:uncharacterized protein (DUF488 family)